MDLDNRDKQEEALERFKFLCENPLDTSIHNNFIMNACSKTGVLLETLGRANEAKVFYLKSIERNEPTAGSWCYHGDCRKTSRDTVIGKKRHKSGRAFAAERLAELESKESNETKAKE